ncbi:MAG: hypothetical protein J6X22_01625 [Muribaculaceae bacterium]|nr:hypothetical protein [Muribaculaceae bacterium]
MRKYIFIIALSLLAIPVFTSCDTETNEEPGGTAIEKMCGYWDVVYDYVDEAGNVIYTDEDVYGAGTVTVFTYNLADNGTNYMWIDDQGTFWAYKMIVNIDYDKRTFWCEEKDYDAAGSGTAIITDGKIIENGGFNEHGKPTDSISFYISFSDDDYAAFYDRMWVHGVRHSGFSADTE